MPTNLYGPGDNYHPEDSHVPAALIRRFHEAKLAGAAERRRCGAPARRGANSCPSTISPTPACFVMKHYSGDDFLNVGTGEDITIAEFARLVAEVVGFQGRTELRHLAPGRRAAEAARRLAADRARLESHDADQGRARQGLC